MGKHSRRKRDLRSAWRRRRGESKESTAFRRHLLAEDAVEDVIASVIDALHQSGFSVEVLDLTALASLCRPVGVVEIDGTPIPVVEPTGTWSNPADFDKRVVAAGLTRFVRPVLPGDEMPPGVVRVG